MTLPQREFYTVHEVASRWGFTTADIAGWSATGHFDVVTGITPALCNDKVVAGKVMVAAFDLLPLFRRCGTGPQSGKVRRVRSKSNEPWHLITDPADGIEVSVADMFITRKQVLKFETQHRLFGRSSASTGSSSPYNWEGMLQALALQIHDHGLPASQGELVGLMQDWFIQDAADGEDIPDERSIRRRITPIWRKLTNSD
jgi:hypothetical protein